ncbi:MAG: hypothetical protein JST47_11105 [Bacteroidetes bacterium]|nr:hypothetical protein [Bacteroidota bacterium]
MGGILLSWQKTHYKMTELMSMMKHVAINLTIVIVIAMGTLGCNSNKSSEISCEYDMKTLFNSYDSSKFFVTKSQNQNWIDVIDKDNLHNADKGVYTFDEMGHLRFYAFVIDSENGYNFSIRYDSLGNIVKKTGREVVRWYMSRVYNDSITISFLLYSVHFKYGKIKLIIGNDSVQKVQLYESSFPNLIEGIAKIPSIILESKDSLKRTAFISGMKLNICTNDTTVFKDSEYIPTLR